MSEKPMLFVGTLTDVELPSGKKIEVPKLKWKTEAIALKIFGSILNEAGVANLASQEPGKILAFMTSLLTSSPDKFTKLVSLLINKDEKWVEEELDGGDVLSIVVPFFNLVFKRLTMSVKTTDSNPSSVTPTQSTNT